MTMTVGQQERSQLPWDPKELKKGSQGAFSIRSIKYKGSVTEP